jgi:hypothetical protein
MIPIIWSWLTEVWFWFTPDKVIALATIVYAFVTTVMFFAIRSQARAAHRQADIADTAAKAAQKSADSLVNVERPWILVRMEPTGPHLREGKVWFTGLAGELGSRQLTDIEIITHRHRVPEKVEFTIKNYGKSPGWVTSQWVDARIVDAMGGLPSTPDYFLRKASFQKEKCSDFLERGCPRKGEIFITRGDLIPVGRKERFLYVYGIVKYRDVWKNEHYTRFCFYWYVPLTGDFDPMGFYAEGPDGCNEET